MHPKKIKDVKTWILENSDTSGSEQPPKFRQTLLLLTGPAGSAKSTMVKLIAKANNFHIVSWTDSPDGGCGFNKARSRPSSSGDFLPYESRLKQFKSFFLRSKKYPSLSFGDTTQRQKKIVLIEEYPFIGKEELHAEFLAIMRTVLQSCRHLVIFILTEHNEKQDDLEKIFSKDIICNPRTAHIRCNPVNMTMLKKASARVIRGEQLKLAPALVKQILDQSCGDVRNVLHALQFYSLHQQKKPEAPKSSAKKKKTQKKKARSKAIEGSATGDGFLTGPDAKYSVFHSLGKILHAKRDTDPETIVERSDFGPSMFTEFLHQNFIEYLPEDDMDSIVEVMEKFSEADVLSRAALARFGNSSSAVPESYCSTFACRGFLGAKSEQVMEDSNVAWKKRKWQGMSGPLSGKVVRIAQQRRAETTAVLGRPRCTTLFTDEAPFVWQVLRNSNSNANGFQSRAASALAKLCSFSSKYEHYDIRSLARDMQLQQGSNPLYFGAPSQPAAVELESSLPDPEEDDAICDF